MPKDFWSKSKVVVFGAGSWGTTLAHLVADNCAEVKLWTRDEDVARAINATRINAKVLPELTLNRKIQATSDWEKCLNGYADVVIWALPSSACREQSRRMAHGFSGREILLHATKGVEEGSLKRISQILREELPCPRVGVISGPNLAAEVARGEPAATVVASRFDEVITAGEAILTTSRFRVYPSSDVVGVEWAGVLKNILAIAAGGLDAMKLGWNARALLISRGLAEMVRFGLSMGAEEDTFVGVAGVGDLLATASSPLSRNYRVGFQLAQGRTLDQVLKDLGSTAEGVRTTRSVWEFARERKIDMPITHGVYQLLNGEIAASALLDQLMQRPRSS